MKALYTCMGVRCCVSMLYECHKHIARRANPWSHSCRIWFFERSISLIGGSAARFSVSRDFDQFILRQSDPSDKDPFFARPIFDRFVKTLFEISKLLQWTAIICKLTIWAFQVFQPHQNLSKFHFVIMNSGVSKRWGEVSKWIKAVNCCTAALADNYCSK